MVYDRYIFTYYGLSTNKHPWGVQYHLVQIRKSSVTALRYWRIDQAHQAELNQAHFISSVGTTKTIKNMVILWDSIGYHGEITGYLVKHDQTL